jgi:hypothetical protein
MFFHHERMNKSLPAGIRALHPCRILKKSCDFNKKPDGSFHVGTGPEQFGIPELDFTLQYGCAALMCIRDS